jgi:hypothetical protein
MAYGFALFWQSGLFGFALGLTVPVLFGGVVIFLNKDNPIDFASK